MTEEPTRNATEESTRNATEESAEDGEVLEVLVLTINEYYYIPKFLDGITDERNLEIVGITTVPPSLGDRNLVAFAFDLLRRFGPRIFLRNVAFYAKYLSLDLLNRFSGTGPAYSARTVAERNGIEYEHVGDVNAPEYVRYVERKDPDVIASVAVPQKFQPRLFTIPDDGTVNIHSSLLPEYRGLSPSFWTLLRGEDETGITVHFVDEELDTGEIILQRPVEIRPDDSLHALNRRVAEEGSALLAEALERIRTGSVSAREMPEEEGSYFSLPTREDVREFVERGNRFY